MSGRFERILSAVLTLAALVIAAATVRREFFTGGLDASQVSENNAGLAYDDDWHDLLRAGIRIGDSTAVIQLIAFVDLECPACRAFHLGAYQEARQCFGSKLTTTFLHFPLHIHRFARIAAVAAECAHEQGRFGELID